MLQMWIVKKQMADSIYELIKRTSTTLPGDVLDKIDKASSMENGNERARYTMDIIQENIKLAKIKSLPLCQDTGTLLFYVNHPAGFIQNGFIQLVCEAVEKATEEGILRQNSVDTISGKNTGNNIGRGHPSFHFHEHEKDELEIRLILKGGGCENMSAQYSLPDTGLCAGRDLDGVKKVILDTVINSQGKGCAPGVLGVCIGGDRSNGHAEAKKQLLRRLDDKNVDSDLSYLEQEIVEISNKTGIGPMGLGGETTLLGCKIGSLNRLPASYFVSISYMCWAYRRHGIILDKNHKIKKWIY